MIKSKKLDNIVWEITLQCNANCIHCGSSAGKKRENELNDDEMLKICDELGELNCREVNLIGGELFLRSNWKDIISRLVDNNIEVTIITNAIALTEDKADFLAQKDVKAVGISLDGMAEVNDYIRQVPNLFEKIFKSAEMLKQRNLPCVAITTLNRLNLFELPKMRERLIASPFEAWQIQLAAPLGRMSEELFLNRFEYYISGIFFAQSRIIVKPADLGIVCLHDFGYYSKTLPNHTCYSCWKGCPAGKQVLGIRSDGKVLGCLSIYKDEFIEGDLRNNTLENIWNSKKLCSWNNRLKRYFSLKGFCKRCEYALICLGGCSDIAFSNKAELKEYPQCYHAIESYWSETTPKNEFEEIFKLITHGRLDSNGDFYLNPGEKLSKILIEKLELNEYEKKLLNLIAT